jgi:hypothetical protein
VAINGALNSLNNLSCSGAGTLRLITNDLSIGGTFTNSSGTFDANNFNITISGNWSNSGTFTANGTGTSTISGNTNFNDFTCTAAGKQLTFTAGSTQTISGTLTLTGAAGNLIILRSSAGGTQWNIDPQGARDVSYVNAKDSKNTNATIITATGSVNSGNNINWDFGGPPAPPAPPAPSENQIDKANKEIYALNDLMNGMILAVFEDYYIGLSADVVIYLDKNLGLEQGFDRNFLFEESRKRKLKRNIHAVKKSGAHF